MPTTVSRKDPRFEIASRGRNLRFPEAAIDRVSRILYCEDPEDAAKALQQVVDAGLRPTVRSSGHCYEDFVVNNPNGAILDVSSLNHVASEANGSFPYSIEPGAMLGNIYQELYKRANVVLPGGTCFTVAAGGHVSGGGYGILARLYGITVDWLSSVEILTVDKNGKVVQRRVDARHDPELFRALRGGQGSNFGLITGFGFRELPPAPAALVQAQISFDWNTMTPEKFAKIIIGFGEYWEKHDQDAQTWGLFGFMTLNNKASGRFGISAVLSVQEGAGSDVSVLTDFLDHFQRCEPIAEAPAGYNPHETISRGSSRPIIGDSVCYGEHVLVRRPWIEAATEGGGSSFVGGVRAKYKSSYMKRTFTEEEAAVLYGMLTDARTQGLVISVDSWMEERPTNLRNAPLISSDPATDITSGHEAAIYVVLAKRRRG